MRIIAGQWGGHKLTPVGKGDSGAHLRPTTDRTRESLFNMLAGGRFGEVIHDALVLDLFAGTGALGLEALSRGASKAWFVDDGRASGKLLRANIRLLDCQAQTKIVARDARRLPTAETACDLVFLDPPYDQDMGALALTCALSQGWLAKDALIVWEERAAQRPPKGFTLQDTRRYGDTTVTLLSVE